MLHFGLIGKKLDYSFSSSFFNDFFKKNDLQCTYENIECADIEEVKSCLLSKKFKGLNITIPYKEQVIPLLSDLSDEAKEIGSVNVVKFENNQYKGYNTDYYGFHQSIKPFLKNSHTKALILGTGGASKAVSYVLKSIGIEVLYVSRTPKNKQQFLISEVNENMLNACKLIINCTPIGTFPDVKNKPALPYQSIGKEHLLIDLIYNPEKSAFLLEGEKYGAEILNGKSMLIEQAKKSWEIWNK
ncbi:MAG: shikimate dehydrogenase [Flavobacteriia bacterium]|nr:shikimate dehydrogenase [Flavobacteriia bacterium]